MSMTKIRGNTQIIPKTITKAQLTDDLKLGLSYLEEGAELLKRNGSVAMTGNLNAASNKIVNLADGVDAKDAINKGQLDAIIAALPDPMEYKGVIDASLGLLPTKTDNGDVYVITVAGTIEGVELQVGAELIANKTKATGVTIADFDVANRMDQVVTVNGKKGVVALELEDLVGMTAKTIEVNQLEGIAGNVQELLDSKLDDTQLITDATLVSADDVTVASSRATKVYTDTAVNATNAVVLANKTAIEAALAQEVANRSAADSALDTRVTTLEGKVANDITDAITAEVARATAADGVLQTAIDAEVARATAAEVAVQGSLDAYKTANDIAVSAEVARATAAEVAIVATADALAAAVAKEVSDRAAAVVAVQGNLDAAVTSLQGQISSVPTPIDEESPLGVIDGVLIINPETQEVTGVTGNREFTLAFVPVAGSTKVFINGIRNRAGADNDYVIVAEAGTGLLKVIRFAEAPLLGDAIAVDYRK